jgi:hypothetical protein
VVIGPDTLEDGTVSLSPSKAGSFPDPLFGTDKAWDFDARTVVGREALESLAPGIDSNVGDEVSPAVSDELESDGAPAEVEFV